MSQLASYRTLLYALFLSTPLITHASPTVVFDGWSSNNGVIDTSESCTTSGISCTTLAEDNGFLQQEIVNHHGKFIRTIVLEADATGSSSTLEFANETFIPQDNKTGFDVNTKQVIRDINDGFESTATIGRTPFNDSNENLVDLLNVELSQTLNGDGFNSSFKLDKYEAEISDGSSYSGRSLDISQSVIDDVTGFSGVFDYREREGAKLSNVDSQLQIDPFVKDGSITLEGETISWNENDHIKSIWISQTSDADTPNSFAFQSFENVHTGDELKTSSFSDDEIFDPFDWDEITLGQSPALP